MEQDEERSGRGPVRGPLQRPREDQALCFGRSSELRLSLERTWCAGRRQKGTPGRGHRPTLPLPWGEDWYVTSQGCVTSSGPEVTPMLGAAGSMRKVPDGTLEPPTPTPTTGTRKSISKQTWACPFPLGLGAQPSGTDVQ